MDKRLRGVPFPIKFLTSKQIGTATLSSAPCLRICVAMQIHNSFKYGKIPSATQILKLLLIDVYSAFGVCVVSL